MAIFRTDCRGLHGGLTVRGTALRGLQVIRFIMRKREKDRERERKREKERARVQKNLRNQDCHHRKKAACCHLATYTACHKHKCLAAEWRIPSVKLVGFWFFIMRFNWTQRERERGRFYYSTTINTVILQILTI